MTYVCLPGKCHLQTPSSNAAPNAVLRKSSHPSIHADLNLPVPPLHGVSMNSSYHIIVQTGIIPEVVNVTTPTVDGAYAPGDTVEIRVHFDEAVVVNGSPCLKLSEGQGLQGAAWFIGGSGTKTLVFLYRVEKDHRTRRLDYVDRHSLELGLGEWIKQKSTHPYTNANLLLPVPRSAGSLSATSAIEIDPGSPYILSVTSTNSGLHHVGDVVRILLL